MYNNQETLNYNISVLDNSFRTNKNNKNVFLDGSQGFYQHPSQTPLSKVAPSVPPGFPDGKKEHLEAFGDNTELNSNIYEALKPLILFLRLIGIFPIAPNGQVFDVTVQWLGYSLALLLVVIAYTGYMKWEKVELVKSAEGRFEEAVIDYLFTVYLVPLVINPLALYEARKQARVLTNMVTFERLYNRITRKKLELNMKNKPMIILVILPILSCANMIVTHVTMVNFRFWQVIPYCYINTITYLLGGAWYLYCDVIGKTATVVAEDFQHALKNIGPSIRVADYRSLWMLLSRIIRDVGNSFGYALTFLCLYLFLIITLTIYGLLSQIQEGFGTKDIGLTITAAFAVAVLFFICDEAHYASTCVRIYFQKKILLVELSWMNDDAQTEINMFLKATEMNPTDMCLCGFFDVNRNLFKSLLATMVTYLVVLLQFQISIPGENYIESIHYDLASVLNSTVASLLSLTTTVKTS